MADGVELATAWIRLTFSAEGSQQQITDELAKATGPAEGAGGDAAAKWGGAFKKGLVGLGIAAAATGFVTGLYNIGATFDNVSDTIRSRTGATGAALAGLVNDAKEVGKNVPESFDKVGQTVADLNTRLGLSGPILQTVAEQYLEAGHILGQDVDIQSTTAAFNAFHIAGDGVSTAMDTLFRISQATGVGINDLASQTQAAAPLVQNIGFSFDQTASLVGTLNKAGLNANKMLATLGPGLVNMAKDGEQPAEVFPKVVAQLNDLITKGDTAGAINLADGIFGTRGAAQFVAAVQSGALNLNDLTGAVGATDDTILGVAEDTADFSEKWSETMNRAEVAIEPLATAIFSGLSEGISAVMPGLESFGGWVADNQWALAAMAGVIGVTLVAAFVAWSVSIWASTVALLANPVTWIILGIVALTAAVIALVMNWDTVVSWISDLWGGFVSWLGDTWDTIAGFFTDTWSNIVGWFQSTGDGIASWWNGLWQGVADFFNGIWQGLVDWFMSIPMFKWLIDTITFVAQNWSTIWDTIRQTFQDVWDGIGSFFRGAANFVLGGIESFVNGAIDLINGIIAPINSVAGAIGAVFGQSWSVPSLSHVSIPKLADGGVLTRGGSVLVGEMGPEILNLPAGASVVPLDEPETFAPDDRQLRIAKPDLDYLADVLATLLRLQTRAA